MADKAGSTRATSTPGRDDTVPATDVDDAAQGAAKLERYRLGVELGRGGMGRVVEAFDTQLGRTVALKEVLPKGGPGIARRFLREVQITARLEHASIVPLYDSGTTPDGRPYYVMRRVSGRPLDEMFSRMRSLGERLTLLPAMLSAIDAIAHAHARGVIHRDLKPANILVGDLGETVVIDWGLAKVVGEEDGEELVMHGPADSLQTQAGSVFGTPGFMAPEQARGEQLGPYGDVYALGATLYQLLAGKPPHVGNSASEVLDRTVNNDPVPPLAEVSEGAPPELVAIVDKALSFDPKMRYPNAAALGEDVRRFLTGQLVAAHRYTPRQRVARFAKRHRAPLVVAALAMVAVAVLAWIGVHQIIDERDAADSARHIAVAGQRAAEDARDRLIKQADTLIVTEASAVVAKNPTEAVAVLKGLSSQSRKQDDARAIAEEAALRGIAWAMQTGDATPIEVEISPDTSRVVVVSLDDVMLRVFDLDARRLMIAKPYSRTTRATWVDRGRHLLVTREGTPPELLDPANGNVQPIPLPPMHSAIATERGDLVIYVDDNKRAGILDVATLTAKLVGDNVTHVDLAADGSWYMVADAKAAIAYDASGHELARYIGEISVTAISRFHQLAVLDGRKVFAAVIDSPHPVWSEVPLELPPAHRPLAIEFRDRELEILSSNATVVGWDNGHVIDRMHLDGFTYRGVEAGNGLILMATSDGRVAYFDAMSTGQLVLPTTAPHIRMSARAGKSRVVVAGNSILLVYDLDAIVPRIIDNGATQPGAFVDENTLLFSPFGEWSWYDIPTKKETRFPSGTHGLALVTQVSADGRVLIKDMFDSRSGHDVSRLLELRKNSTRPRVIATGNDLFATFVQGNAIVMCPGDNRVLGGIGEETPREIVRLDGNVDSIAPAGHRRFVAISESGDLARGSIEGGDVERSHARVDHGAIIGGMGNGTALIGAGNRLLRWDTTVHELARFDKAISKVDPLDSGVVVVFADQEARFYDYKTGTTHRLSMQGRSPPVLNQDGSTFAAFGPNDDVNIVELPSLARFTLPRVFTPGRYLNISPDGRHIVQQSNGRLALWALPVTRTDLSVWLDELTNASEDAESMMVWPWQLKTQP